MAYFGAKFLPQVYPRDACLRASLTDCQTPPEHPLPSSVITWCVLRVSRLPPTPPSQTTLSIAAPPTSTIEPLAALHTEAVAAQVVVATRRADQTPRWVGLQPPLTLTAVPDAVLGTQHPSSPLAVQDCEVAHRDSKGPGLQRPDAALLDQVAITQLGFGEWIDSHRESIARRTT